MKILILIKIKKYINKQNILLFMLLLYILYLAIKMIAATYSSIPPWSGLKNPLHMYSEKISNVRVKE